MYLYSYKLFYEGINDLSVLQQSFYTNYGGALNNTEQLFFLFLQTQLDILPSLTPGTYQPAFKKKKTTNRFAHTINLLKKVLLIHSHRSLLLCCCGSLLENVTSILFRNEELPASLRFRDFISNQQDKYKNF